MLTPLNTVKRHPLLHQLPQRAQLPKKTDPLPYRVQDIIDLALSGEAANAEADARVGALVAVAERAQHVAGLQRGGRARAAAAERDVLERHQQRLALHVRKRDVDAAGVEVLRGAILRRVFESEEAGEEAVGERADAGSIVLEWGKGLATKNREIRHA